MSEHAVLVHITNARAELGLDEIEDPLIEAIAAANAGEFDGNEIGPVDATLYMYGPDADRLFEVVKRVIAMLDIPADVQAVRRYGEPGAPEDHVWLKGGPSES